MKKYFIHKKHEKKILTGLFSSKREAEEYLNKIRDKFYLQEYSLGEQNAKGEISYGIKEDLKL